MLLKLGVDISKLSDPIRRQLTRIDGIYLDLTGTEAVVTSTYEGTHSPSSLHYVHRAIDLRLPIPAHRTAVVQKMKQQLGKDYDVVLETNHIHVEHDPK